MQVTPETPQGIYLDVIPDQNPKAEKDLSNLLDRAFSLSGDAHYMDDFPVWGIPFGPASGRRIRIGAYHRDQLIASACVRLAFLKTPRGPHSVAIIGAVATDESYRGKGVASQAVSYAAQWAAERGAVAAFLWGSEHAFYERMGFRLCGEQVLLPINDLKLNSNGSEKLQRGWNSALFKLLQQRKHGLQMDFRDLSWVGAHKNVQWYWSGPTESPKAYAALGRGIDMAGIIHEWGGEQASLENLLAEIRKLHPGSTLLGNMELLKPFATFDQLKEFQQFLCMAKILDPAKILSVLRPDISFRADKLDGGWKLNVEENGLVITEQNIPRLFFGPRTSDIEYWPQIFPLPLWIWGLDSG